MRCSDLRVRPATQSDAASGDARGDAPGDAKGGGIIALDAGLDQSAADTAPFDAGT